jgi:hypothetical protein
MERVLPVVLTAELDETWTNDETKQEVVLRVFGTEVHREPAASYIRSNGDLEFCVESILRRVLAGPSRG